jgi:anti-sigma B factor antagonist
MEIKRHEQGDQVTLAVQGEIEVYSLTEFSRIAESYLGGPKVLELDFEELEYIDSSGLGFLVTLHERMVRQGQRLRMTKLQPHVARVFKITHLDRILDIVMQEQPSA